MTGATGEMLGSLATLAAHAPAGSFDPGAVGAGPSGLLLILALPLLASVLCAVYAALGVKSRLPAWTSVALLAAAFVVTLQAQSAVAAADGPLIVHGFQWIHVQWGDAIGQSLTANFALYIDHLTTLWMLFVTGLGALIALYASEYMAGDRGYARFFGFFNLFVFMMSCLVMGDSLLLLYVGWEGVGLCSYLLIGYFYQRPSAAEAAKKAFIVNRIGDLGLAVGLMLAFVEFGSVQYRDIFAAAASLHADAAHGGHVPWSVQAIPLLLTLGAFGKSAQLPLYVWLPDAMEGPTPVSALIHAATMVTAGVYLVARFMPLYELNPAALAIVAWVGGLTALFAATMGMAVFDIKRVMAYSTVSQLGFMFVGLGVLTSAGAAYHVLTHAFFKACLFLACGAVMHGFAGQLDLRRLSGLSRVAGWRVVTVAMLVGCACLAGVPGTSGYFSKDMILAEAFVTAGPGYALLGLVVLATAGLTAYYAFRVFFRVFMGPVDFHPGEDSHGHGAEDHAHGHSDGHDDGHGSHHGHEGEWRPHAPGWAVNLVLIVLSVGALAAAAPYFMGGFAGHGGVVAGWVAESTAAVEGAPFTHPGAPDAARHPSFFGLGDPHKVMYFVSGAIALLGIGVAWRLHLSGRTSAAAAPRADDLKAALGPIGVWAEHKWYVDEFYDFLLRRPLWLLANVFYFFDALVVDGLVNLFGWIPRAVGASLRPSQNGVLQSYAFGMAVGLAMLLVIVWVVR